MPPHPLSRRDLLRLLLAAAAAPLVACDAGPAASTPPPAASAPPPPPPPTPSAPTPSPPTPDAPAWRTLDFPRAPGRIAYRAELLPAEDAPGTLIALHGRGESGTLDRGASGWRRYYLLDDARRALLNPPLTEAAFRGLVTPERLRLLNDLLAAQPWRDLRLLTPWTPDLIHATPQEARPFARFLLDTLVPQADAQDAPLAIDGVSLGGRVALLVGLYHPERFRSVGAMQPAITLDEIPELVRAAQRAHRDHGLQLRLVTSTRDGLRRATEALSRALTRAEVPHAFLLTEGPHDYIWNQGPGAVEMLLWHERLLRGLTPPGP